MTGAVVRAGRRSVLRWVVGVACALALAHAGVAAAEPDAAGSASPPPPGPATVVTVDCATATIDTTVTVTAGHFAFEPLAPVAVDHAARFLLPPTDDVEPYPRGDRGLSAPAGAATCLKFTGEGEFTFHSGAHAIEGTLWVRPWYELLAERPVEDDGTFFLPRDADPERHGDTMFYAVLGVSLVFFVAIAVVIVFFVWKYRHRPGHTAQPSPAHNDTLEITWTVIPSLITVFLFFYGWRSYQEITTPPQHAVEIQVQAKRWAWNFVHQNGATDADLHIPPNTPVRLVMTSSDVIHSLYVPVLRIKQDILPRRYTYANLFATRPGTYRLDCAEYCGTNHSQMSAISSPIPPALPEGRRAVVVVHRSMGDYEAYLQAKGTFTGPPEILGRRLYDQKGCGGCHTIDGSPRIGPSWFGKGEWGTDITIEGGTVKMDENYIRESILNPAAKRRPGYPSQMPSFEGQLKESELAALIAFIHTLKQ